MESLLFFGAVLFAEVAGTIAGFGSSTILLPAALFFFDFPTALILVAFAHISGNIGRISFFRHGLDRRILFWFGIPSVILTIVGASLVARTSVDILKSLLGVFLVCYGILSLFGKLSAARAAVGGGLSGFLAGLIGTGGALRGAFLTAFGLPKERYIATAAAIALAVDATRIPIYLREGFLPRGMYWYPAALFFLALGGSFIGGKVVARIPQEKFRRAVLVALLLIGIYFVQGMAR